MNKPDKTGVEITFNENPDSIAKTGHDGKTYVLTKEDIMEEEMGAYLRKGTKCRNRTMSKKSAIYRTLLVSDLHDARKKKFFFVFLCVNNE